MKEQNYNRFDKNLKELVAVNLRMENSEASLDSDLALHIKERGNIESTVELQEAITSSCNKSFNTREITNNEENLFHGGQKNLLSKGKD